MQAPLRDRSVQAEREAAFAQIFEETLQLVNQEGGGGDPSDLLGSGMNAEEGLLSVCASEAYGPLTGLGASFAGLHPGTALSANRTSSQIPGALPWEPVSSVAAASGQLPLNQMLTPVYASTMERFLKSRGGGSLAAPAGVGGPSAVGAVDAGSATANESGVNKNALVEWMDAHALTRSIHHCAMYVRKGLEAAGLDTSDRPASGDAGDYGPYLLRHGAHEVPMDSYNPQVGDTAVFEKTAEHPFGHIEIFDGQRWVSDFRQNSFSPYRDAESTPPFKVYRLS